MTNTNIFNPESTYFRVNFVHIFAFILWTIGPKEDIFWNYLTFKAASEILQNMDETVNPCDDFYQFACGNFIKKTAIPDDRTRVSSFSVLSDELLSQVCP